MYFRFIDSGYVYIFRYLTPENFDKLRHNVNSMNGRHEIHQLGQTGESRFRLNKQLSIVSWSGFLSLVDAKMWNTQCIIANVFFYNHSSTHSSHVFKQS